MPDSYKDSEIIVQTLALQKVLEGLIHNINTPLNLILGYSQQLKKQHPEITKLDRIYEAGLLIDDLMQSCSRNIIHRLGREKESFELNIWLNDEIKQFNNVLDIKHMISFQAAFQSKPIWVDSNPILLSLFLESLVLYIRNSVEKTAPCVIGIDLKYAVPARSELDSCFRRNDTEGGQFAEISLRLPDIGTENDLNAYLGELKTELESYSGISFSQEYPFSWVFNATDIKLFVPVKGD